MSDLIAVRAAFYLFGPNRDFLLKNNVFHPIERRTDADLATRPRRGTGRLLIVIGRAHLVRPLPLFHL